MGVLGDFGPLNVVIHHRDPQKAHACVNPRLLGELPESVTDTHTHTGKFIFCPCIALDRQKSLFLCTDFGDRQTDRQTDLRRDGCIWTDSVKPVARYHERRPNNEGTVLKTH